MLKILFMGILFCCLTLLLSIMGIGTDHLESCQRESPLIYMYLMIIAIITISIMVVYIKGEGYKRP